MNFLDSVRQKISETWLELCVNLHETVRQEGPAFVYALAVVSALAQVIASNSFTAFNSLIALLGSVGGNLIAGKVDRAVDADRLQSLLGELSDKLRGLDEIAAAKVVQQELQANADLQQVTDLLLARTEALPIAQQTFAQQHATASEREWFADVMQQALQQTGSRLQIHAEIHTGAGSKVGVGETVIFQETHYHGEATGAGAAATKAEQLKRRYLQNLQTDCNLLPLAAIAEDRDPHAALRLTLDKVYIDLNTTLWVDEHGKVVQREAMQVSEKREKTRPLPVLQAFAHETQLVILGDPGSGKSSFINHLLWELAQRKLHGNSEALADWPHRDCLPVRVLLRELLVTLQQENAVQFLDLGLEAQRKAFCRIVHQHLRNALTNAGLEEFAEPLREALDAGHCLVVFDGLDEAALEQRALLRAAVESFCALAPGNRVLVTCRILSYDRNAPLAGFDDVTLAPFDDEQVKAFIGRWYQALHRLGKPEKWASDKAEDLRHAVQRLPQSMVRNPMLLTTLASVHANNVELPKQRVRLYKQAATLLLRRWQEAKAGRISLFEEIGLTDETKMYHALWELGYIGQEAGQAQETAADVPREQALKILEANFSGVPKPLLAAEQFLNYVDQAAGLLNGRGGGSERVYAFPHRTFQEYFAGCYLGKRTRGNFKREVKKLLEQGDYWRLAAQLGVEELLFNDSNEGPALEIAYGLCGADCEPQSLHDWRGLMWAGHFAATIGSDSIAKDVDNGGPAFLQRLRQRLAALLAQGHLPARERAEAGFALGLLGDERPGVCTLPPLWIDLPGGRFLMGDENAGPPHEVELSPFKISKYPITNAQFAEFARKGGYDEQQWWSKEGWAYRQKDDWQQPRFWDDEEFNLPNQPVVGVSWFEAEAFCNWLTVRLTSGTGQKALKVLLPTEAEWEYAARGSEGRRYSWGSENPTLERANYDDSQIGRTTAVGCYPQGATQAGALDLAGNVEEWCRDWYAGDYYADCKKRGCVKDPAGPEKGADRVLRGGSWFVNDHYLRASSRVDVLPHGRYLLYGFRVVFSAES